MSIRQLPHGVAKLISSSQIISSVSSVIKELVENSLDAGATVIDVKLDKYGLEKIEVRDNGSGINNVDIHNVCRPNYTSKIYSFEDLDSLSSYGFRGEALSSLCSVAEISIVTKSAEEDIASSYLFDNNGKVVKINPSHVSGGTVVTISNLFKNVPVRRQIYDNARKLVTELKRIERVIKILSIVHPKLKVSLTHNKCLIWLKTSMHTLKQSFMQVYHHMILRNIEYYTHSDNDISVELLICKRDCNWSVLCEPINEAILFYVNRRPVRDKKVEKVVLEEMTYLFQSALPSNKCPLTLVSIRVPAAKVDVNLEPDKTRVFMTNHDNVVQLIRDAIMLHFYNGKTRMVVDTLSNKENETLSTSTDVLQVGSSCSLLENCTQMNFNQNDESNPEKWTDDDYKSRSFEPKYSECGATSFMDSDFELDDFMNEPSTNTSNCGDPHQNEHPVFENPVCSILTKRQKIDDNVPHSEIDNISIPSADKESYEETTMSFGFSFCSPENFESTQDCSSTSLKSDQSNSNTSTTLSQWSKGNVSVNGQLLKGPSVLTGHHGSAANTGREMMTHNDIRCVSEGGNRTRKLVRLDRQQRTLSQWISHNENTGPSQMNLTQNIFTEKASRRNSESPVVPPRILERIVSNKMERKDLVDLLNERKPPSVSKQLVTKSLTILNADIELIRTRLNKWQKYCNNSDEVHLISQLKSINEYLCRINNSIAYINVENLRKNVLHDRKIIASVNFDELQDRPEESSSNSEVEIYQLLRYWIQHNDSSLDYKSDCSVKILHSFTDAIELI